jgi:hypothetical protein
MSTTSHPPRQRLATDGLALRLLLAAPVLLLAVLFVLDLQRMAEATAGP